jgi:hypothetical protein
MSKSSEVLAERLHAHFSNKWEKRCGCPLKVTVTEGPEVLVSFKAFFKKAYFRPGESFGYAQDELPSWEIVVTLGFYRVWKFIEDREVYGRSSAAGLSDEDLEVIKNAVADLLV